MLKNVTKPVVSQPAAPKAKLSKVEILQAVAAGQLDAAEAAELLGEVQVRGSLRCKVSEKGAISVYNLQRMPVTLYAEQWPRLIEFGAEILAFIEANKGQLKYKGQ